MKEECLREVVELHRFFEQWFNGTVAQEDVIFGRFAHILAPDFTIIPPSGNLIPRQPLLDGLWSAYGSDSHIKIWVENANFRPITPSIGLVIYQEWQTTADKTTVRISSAIFRSQLGLPNNIVWLHVHETWFPLQ